MRRLVSMHWNNIDPAIVEGQRRAFAALGHAIAQTDATGTAHGAWIDSVLATAQPDDVFLFVDIDALALTSAIIERAFAAAEAGRVFGVAQTANHVPDRDFVFVGPAFLCLSRRCWDALDQPSATVDAEHDVGMRISRAAVTRGVPLELLYPNYVAVPRWRLSNKGCTGFGTFYGESSVFHLFEARRTRRAGLRQIFDYVVDRVVAGKEIDYVALYRHMHSAGYRLGALRLYVGRRAAKTRRKMTSRPG